MAAALDTETFKGGSATISFVSQLAEERAVPFLLNTSESPALTEAKKAIAAIAEESKSSHLEGGSASERFAKLRESIAARKEIAAELGEKVFGSAQREQVVGPKDMERGLEAAIAKFGAPTAQALSDTPAPQFVPTPAKSRDTQIS